ncbi:hypothetical protein OF83DRAFT_1178073 [Amylostereum chailletii]|nr:hypothetical protein OF83DRAFT_1178073 [Amylostereum chailletii]
MPLTRNWIGFSNPRARHLVRVVLSSVESPLQALSTRDVYETIHERFPRENIEEDRRPWQKESPPGEKRKGKLHIPAPTPPHLDHVVKSMAFLKRVVLPDMTERGQVEKVTVHRGIMNPDGEREDRVKSLAGTTAFPSAHTKPLREWLWMLREGFDGDYVEPQSGAFDLPPDRRPTTKSKSQAQRQRKAVWKQGLSFKRLETPFDFMNGKRARPEADANPPTRWRPPNYRDVSERE